MDVGIRRHGGYKYRVGLAYVLVEVVGLQRSGRVDDHAVGPLRYAQVEAPGHVERARVGGNPMDRRMVRGALLEPARTGALGVEVHRDGSVTASRVHGGD